MPLAVHAHGGWILYQRNTLTVNHGTYFIDSGVPREFEDGDVTGSPPSPASDSMTSAMRH